MRYTGPKFKICRREGINIFGVEKYDIKKRRKLPGQHGGNMPRLSEYGKIMRNKQVLKRSYQLTEKQFKNLITIHSYKFSKNKGVGHDVAVVQFLERRLDNVILRSGLAKTIMQARQIVSHSLITLNGKKHNISSYYVKSGDLIEIKEKLKGSVLFTNCPLNSGNYILPTWLKVDKSSFKIEIIDLPRKEEINVSVDVLKVIEYYARA